MASGKSNGFGTMQFSTVAKEKFYNRISMYLGTLTFLETKKSNLNGFWFTIARVEMSATCLYLHGTVDS